MSDRTRYRDEFLSESSEPDRGVSEVISFALVFSLITASVALVYVSGIGGLEDTRSGEQLNNAERAFDVLADNVGDIYQQGAPSRATEIKLSDAQMQFGDTVRVNITVRNLKRGGNISAVNYQPIVYSADSDTDLLYSNGALLREDRSGAVMRKNPPFLLTLDEGPDNTAGTADDEKSLILPVIQTRNAGPESTGSQRTVLVRTLLATRDVTIAEDDPGELSGGNPDGTSGTEYNVTVRIQTSEERSNIWLNHIEDQVTAAGGNFDARAGSGACDIIEVDGDPATETVECSLAAENVYSTVTRIDVIYR